MGMTAAAMRDSIKLKLRLTGDIGSATALPIADAEIDNWVQEVIYDYWAQHGTTTSMSSNSTYDIASGEAQVGLIGPVVAIEQIDWLNLQSRYVPLQITTWQHVRYLRAVDGISSTGAWVHTAGCRFNLVLSQANSVNVAVHVYPINMGNRDIRVHYRSMKNAVGSGLDMDDAHQRYVTNIACSRIAAWLGYEQREVDYWLSSVPAWARAFGRRQVQQRQGNLYLPERRVPFTDQVQ